MRFFPAFPGICTPAAPLEAETIVCAGRGPPRTEPPELGCPAAIASQATGSPDVALKAEFCLSESSLAATARGLNRVMLRKTAN